MCVLFFGKQTDTIVLIAVLALSALLPYICFPGLKRKQSYTWLIIQVLLIFEISLCFFMLLYFYIPESLSLFFPNPQLFSFAKQNTGTMLNFFTFTWYLYSSLWILPVIFAVSIIRLLIIIIYKIAVLIK